MVGERFQTSTDMIALPVIDHKNTVAGIVWRDEFMTLYASRYGRDLHGRKPIHHFMDADPVIADTSLPLQKLSQLITSNDTSHQHSIFIITKDDHYHGVGSLMDLLRKITDLQLTTARHANPLTGLPGNVPISEHIQDVLIEQNDAVICYFDLDNFKPYNDYYGFGKGDQVIRSTAHILLQHVDVHNDFVGHVGGDDFIILFESANWQDRCQQILTAFLSIHSELYKDTDLQANGINAQDRYGNAVFYPLLSLSIGAVRLQDFVSIKTEADLTEYASQAKSTAKKQSGNSLYLLSSGTRS
jgi:diguanylate cyclase (GGDEF)-like protein